MRQIYINTMFGTTRVDYNEHDDRDIIIVASPGTNIEAVILEHIESSGINPQSIETFKNTDKVEFEPVWQEEKRRILFNDMSTSEEYMRDLIGDDAYENFESQ